MSINQVKEDTTNIVANVWEFVEAASATICAGFAIYGGYNLVNRQEYRIGLFVAGVVMALIGGKAIVKHFNK